MLAIRAVWFRVPRANDPNANSFFAPAFSILFIYSFAFSAFWGDDRGTGLGQTSRLGTTAAFILFWLKQIVTFVAMDRWTRLARILYARDTSATASIGLSFWTAAFGAIFFLHG